LAVWAEFIEPDTIVCGGRESFERAACLTSLSAGTSLEETVEQAAAAWHVGPDSQPLVEGKTLLKLACTLCLLGQDPETIEPEVLAKDREKWARTHDPAIAERAVRRGKLGWLVGAKMEVLPHVRRPQMALRWTSPGGKIPKIVPVKWSIVHREKVAHVPTGRMDAEVTDRAGNADES
jgi:hypothetical protein